MGDGDARLGELLGSLSLATDEAAGAPPETALRTAILAVRIAEVAGVSGPTPRDLFYTGVLRFIGSTAFSHEMAWTYGAGDDLALMRALNPADLTKPQEMFARARDGINPAAPEAVREEALRNLATDPHAGEKLSQAHCDLAMRMAARLGMSYDVIASLEQGYERWDGYGGPRGLRGDAIRVGARVLHLAWRMSLHLALEGPGPTRDMLAARAGGEFDPTLAAAVQSSFFDVVAGLTAPSVWELYLETEPRPFARVGTGGVERVARAFAHYVDVKSPYLLGHSTGVANLARAAAGDDPAARDVYVAGLLHDLGRVAVANGVWDKAGPLNGAERDRERGYVYQTERILTRTALFAPYARLASLHHERLDGSGYPRGLGASALGRPARLLAAADVYRALIEERAYRPAHDPHVAADILAAEAREGRLCSDAVDAVLAAADPAGAKAPGARLGPLSEPEAKVIRFMALGLSDEQVGARLFLSPKILQRHLDSLFEKTGVRTRAAAAVFTVDNDLA